MLSGLREILLITTPHDQDAFFRLLGDGSQLGVKISYVVQDQPNGLAEALILGEKFLDGEKCALILGDNLFYGPGLGTHLQQNTDVDGALDLRVPGQQPLGLRRRGVRRRRTTCISIEEKPSEPKSSYAVPGIYFYDERASEFARQLMPSARGELEITALNNAYLERGELRVEVLSRATTWLDTGTHESLYEAGGLIRTLQHRTGMRIGDVEQIARDQGWVVTRPQLVDGVTPSRVAKNAKTSSRA